MGQWHCHGISAGALVLEGEGSDNQHEVEGGRGEGGGGGERATHNTMSSTTRSQEIKGWDKNCQNGPGIYLFCGGSLILVLTEQRQQGMSPVVKGWQINMYTLDAKIVGVQWPACSR